MHVSGRKLAISGLLAALSVVLVTLAAVIETSSLFFIAAASFMIGIVLREWGKYCGLAFYVATVLLCLLVAPAKMYGLTFAGMGAYLVANEFLFEVLAKKERIRYRLLFLWIGKGFIFNVMYIPILLFMPKVIIAKPMNTSLFLLLLFAGQAAFVLYDFAHHYFQTYIWNKWRGNLMRNI